MAFRRITWRNWSAAWPRSRCSPTRSCPPPRSSGRTSKHVTVSDRARRVRLLCVDVDGVLTDAGMYYGPDGEVLKKFNTRDGMGLARVREAGVAVAIISGEDSAIVHARAAKLKIDEVFSGVADKFAIVKHLSETHNIAPDEIAYIGD